MSNNIVVDEKFKAKSPNHSVLKLKVTKQMVVIETSLFNGEFKIQHHIELDSSIINQWLDGDVNYAAVVAKAADRMTMTWLEKNANIKHTLTDIVKK